MERCMLWLRISTWTGAVIDGLAVQQAEEKWKSAMKQEDWHGLTPLFYQHVNPYGRFTLDMTERIPLSLKPLLHKEMILQKLCRTYLLCGYRVSSLTQGL